MHPDCFFCHIRTLEKQINKFELNEDISQNLISDFINYYQNNSTQTNPHFAQQVHKLIRIHTQNSDPYKVEKQKSNDEAQKIASKWQNEIELSNNKLKAALKLSIVANIIDFGPGHKINIEQNIEELYNKDLKIDQTNLLINKLSEANNILFLADNAGEFVFDILLLKLLKNKKITIALRGEPVINDVTTNDIKSINIPDNCKIITNGNNAPSTILSQCTKEFITEYNNADLILAKGQGNFEGLMHERDSRLFFLLIAKCDVIANYVGVNKFDSLLINSASIKNN